MYDLLIGGRLAGRASVRDGGLAALSRNGRLRAGYDDERIELFLAQFGATGSGLTHD